MPRRWPRFPIAIPTGHFMAFAPLDIWARLLLARRLRLWPRYWPRLALALMASAIATAVTLPERLVIGVILALRGERRMAVEHTPGALVVLGYFRSGTTHLHYLLSCDPRFRTPTWAEALAPHGFAAAWTFFTLFMIPFLSSRRPQDDVAIGPGWPAEDDFAVNNLALASSLPGRFVFPSMHAYFGRFHGLEGLSPRELRRWRAAQAAFLARIGWLASGRAILLKSPSHTARVPALRDVFGERVKFVHISRDAPAVLKSNVSMYDRLGTFNLEDPPAGAEVAGRIAAEYARTERLYDEAARSLPLGRIAEVRYEDLVADPLGELRRVYADLSLHWTPQFEARVTRYLQSIRGYRAATAADARDTASQTPEELRWLRERFGHDRPARPAVPLPPAPPDPPAERLSASAARATAVMLAFCVAWLAWAWLTRDRSDWLIWPAGLLIGLTTVRRAPRGTVRLGVIAAVVTFVALVLISFPATFIAEYMQRPVRNWEWERDVWTSTRRGFLGMNNIFWVFMGTVTAYRVASRPNLRPPARG